MFWGWLLSRGLRSRLVGGPFVFVNILIVFFQVLYLVIRCRFSAGWCVLGSGGGVQPAICLRSMFHSRHCRLGIFECCYFPYIELLPGCLCLLLLLGMLLSCL